MQFPRERALLFPEEERAAGQTDGRGPRHIKIYLGWLALDLGEGEENLFSNLADPVLVAENEVLSVIYVIFMGQLILS